MQIHLKTPIEVSINGQMQPSEFLNIEAPCRNNITDVAELQEIASAALMAAQALFANRTTEAQNTDDAKFDGATAIMMLKMGGKYKDAIKAFDAFLLKYGTFDEVKVQTGTLSRIDLQDYESALGRYFAEYCFFDSIQA